MAARIAALGVAVIMAAGCAQLPSLTMDEAAGVPAALEQTPAESDRAAGFAAPSAEAATPQAAPSPRTVAVVLPPPADVWERVRRGFRIADRQGPLVTEWEQWYASRPDYVRRMVERSSHFLYHVIEEVERRGMPAEIALLPMIESAYNPHAYSRAHASGMWQFISSTGKLYGLRQNFWYDGRRDPIAATSAALDYLQKLYGMFGDWSLALAAYNWGEGAVGRAIARNEARGLPGDYDSLTMPAETRNYLPKLQAVKNIVANPQAFGLALEPVPNRPYFTTVTTTRHIDVRLAARLAGMTIEEFRFLNPAHNKPVIKVNGEERLVVPLDRADAFTRSLEAHTDPLATWEAYTVKRGDQPERLAARLGMSLAQLKEANGIGARGRILPGQVLVVPIRDDGEPHLPDLPSAGLVRVSDHSSPPRTSRKSGRTSTAARTTQRSASRPAGAKQAAAVRKTATRKKRTAAPRPAPSGVMVAETAGSRSR